MLRRALLAALSLGVILVAYGVYKSRNAPIERPPVELPEITVATAAPASQSAMLGSQNVRVSPGHGAFYVVYDPVTQEPQYTFQAREWEPQNANDFRLLEPDIARIMNDGREIRIRAGSGDITAEQVGRNQLKPKRGWLRDGVIITVDLTTREWRAAHPDKAAPEDHADRIVSVRMESLYFDDDLALIRTEGPVDLHTDKVDVEARGLHLTYNKTGDQLDQLSMPGGGTIRLRGGLDLDSGNGSTLEAQLTPPAYAADARKAAATAEAASADAAATAPATQEAKRPNVYMAKFGGPIRLTQTSQGEIAASLDADRVLELIFDLDQQDRQSIGLGETPAAGPDEPEAPAQEQADSQVTLTWAGELHVLPTAPPEALQTRRTTLVRAAGQKVVLTDARNTITCTELTYDTAQRSGSIVAEGEHLATVTDNRGRSLAGREIRFDETAGVLEVNGPGRAVEPGGSQLWASAEPQVAAGGDPTDIRWEQRMRVRFRTRPTDVATNIPFHYNDRIDRLDRLPRQGILASAGRLQPRHRPASLGASPLEGLVAESIELRGEVTIRTSDESLSAQELDVDLNAAGQAGKLFGSPTRAEGRGGVQLVSRDQKIGAETLEVYFAQREGRSVPVGATAAGNVVAIQDTTTVKADSVSLALTEIQPEQAGGGQARPRVAIRHVEASGNVTITDPQEGLDLAAQKLTAAIPDGRRVRHVVLEGTDDAYAHVGTKDYNLAGPQIKADLQTQDIQVDSPGSLQLIVRQGLEGSDLRDPQPLVIRWKQNMRMDGGRNVAVFAGGVEARTEDQATAVTADTLTVYFQSVGREEPERLQPNPVADTLERVRMQLASVWPEAGEWLRIRPRRSERPALADAAPREPVLVIADGNARAGSDRYDADTNVLTGRLLVTGPSLTADLRRRQMVVNGEGNLLIENYALARAAARMASAQTPTTLPLQSIDETELSQTYFHWTNAMSFVLPDRLAVFDGQVEMRYFSGSHIRRADELAQAMEANVEHLRMLPGRKARLNCANLVVQFSETDEPQAAPTDAGDPWVQQARLQNIAASGKVYLEEQSGAKGGSRTLICDRLQYRGREDTFVIQGAPGETARIFIQEDMTQVPAIHEGRQLFLNRQTGQIIGSELRGRSVE